MCYVRLTAEQFIPRFIQNIPGIRSFFIVSSNDNHPDRESVKAVDRRARVLTEEYRKKARVVERVYGRLMKGQWAGFRGSCWTMGK